MDFIQARPKFTLSASFFCKKLVSFKLLRECLGMNENSTEYVIVYRGTAIGKTRNNVVLPIFYGIKKFKDHIVYSTKVEHILLHNSAAVRCLCKP